MINVPGIDYELLYSALSYYKNKGYTFLDVPWVVDKKYIDITKPDIPDLAECTININDSTLYPVASAEQSFLSIWDTLEEEKPYMAVTPCFRDEKEDATHFKYFMK